MKVIQRLSIPLLMTGMVMFVHLVRAAEEAPSSSLTPQTLVLQPRQFIGATPSWAVEAPSVHGDSDSVDFSVPSLAAQDEIGCFALTTVFEDNGDGGPLVEWISKSGDHILLSAGLGESGVALGVNSRTILIPQALSLDGGRVKVSFVGRLSRLLSVSLKPARELGVAALEGLKTPALITGNGTVLSREEVSGFDVTPLQGDREEGQVVHADLSPRSLRLDAPGTEATTEFMIPLAVTPAGSQLVADVGGLDPDSWIEVRVNGESRGVLAPALVSLSDPGTLLSKSGRLRIAGWRPCSLLLPARLWKPGENSLLLTLHRAAGDEGNPVYLRGVSCDLLFQQDTPSSPAPLSTNQKQPSETYATEEQTLSTGSSYGNPSPSLFRTAPPAPSGS
jgi:hypothetical protein